MNFKHVLVASVVFVAVGGALAPVVWVGSGAGVSSADISQVLANGEMLATELQRAWRRNFAARPV